MRHAFLALAIGLLAPAGAAGQTAQIGAGDTIRIWSSVHRLSGARRVVQGLTRESVSLVPRAGGSPVTTMSWTDINRIDVQRGRRSRWRAALKWGLGVGFAGALLAGSLTREPADRELTVPLAALGGFAAGALIGGLRDPVVWVQTAVPWPELGTR